MNGEVWFPLVNFMQSWGEGHGWETSAWIKYQNEGENPKYRKLKLSITVAIYHIDSFAIH